jgi:hypothetical protein
MMSNKCSCYANPRQLHLFARDIGFIGNIDHYRLIYLCYNTNSKDEYISKITRYALSTIKTYRNKYRCYKEKAQELFSDGYYCNGLKVYVDCDKESIKGPCAYIMEIYDEDGFVRYLKYGKSHEVLKRATDHLSNYGLDFVVIKHSFPCATDLDAETLEKQLIKWHKNRCPDKYIQNDRFDRLSFDEDILSDPTILAFYELVKR